MTESSKIVWSIPTRIIHWTLAMIVLLNIFALEEGDPLHRYLGYFAIILILLRIIIGFKGLEYERFANFPIYPKDLLFFFRTHFLKKHLFPGHNPAASIVYIAIWTSVLALGVTGWMLGLDAYFGDEALENIHQNISNLLLGLVIVHLLGIFVDSFLYRRKTWLGMITGKKEDRGN